MTRKCLAPLQQDIHYDRRDLQLPHAALRFGTPHDGFTADKLADFVVVACLGDRPVDADDAVLEIYLPLGEGDSVTKPPAIY